MSGNKSGPWAETFQHAPSRVDRNKSGFPPAHRQHVIFGYLVERICSISRISLRSFLIVYSHGKRFFLSYSTKFSQISTLFFRSLPRTTRNVQRCGEKGLWSAPPSFFARMSRDTDLSVTTPAFLAGAHSISQRTLPGPAHAPKKAFLRLPRGRCKPFPTSPFHSEFSLLRLQAVCGARSDYHFLLHLDALLRPSNCVQTLYT